MLPRNTRWLVFVALVLGLVALVGLWPDKPSRDDKTSRLSSTDVTQQVSAGAPSRADTAAPASIAVDRVGPAGASQVATSAMETSRQVNGAPVRLQVHAPSDVQVGEVFQARIDFEANGGVRQLMFAVSYESPAWPSSGGPRVTSPNKGVFRLSSERRNPATATSRSPLTSGTDFRWPEQEA